VNSWSGTIRGQPCSKGNSYHIVTLGKPPHPAIVKSKEALAYVRSALLQIPRGARMRLTGPVRVTIRVFYATERPDLDVSLILDCLQDQWSRTKPRNPIVPSQRVLVQPGVFCNDRQVRELHLYHGVDRVNPRSEILVEALTAQQTGLALPDPTDLATELLGG
jgi:hypothetical protein